MEDGRERRKEEIRRCGSWVEDVSGTHARSDLNRAADSTLPEMGLKLALLSGQKGSWKMEIKEVPLLSLPISSHTQL